MRQNENFPLAPSTPLARKHGTQWSHYSQELKQQASWKLQLLERFEPSQPVHRAHIIARANGGSSEPVNLIPLNWELNLALQHTNDHIMAAIAGHARTLQALESSWPALDPGTLQH